MQHNGAAAVDTVDAAQRVHGDTMYLSPVQCNIMVQLLLTLSTLLNVSVVHIHFRSNFGSPVSTRMRQLMFGRVAKYIDLLRTVAKFKKREQKASTSLGTQCFIVYLFVTFFQAVSF